MLPIDQKFYTKTKHLLKQGKRTCGAWLQIASPFTAEIMARAQFDWCMIDMEHGPGDILTLISQLQAIKGYGVDTFVRAPWNDFVQIKRILDAGVNGVLVPYVNSKKEAEAAVKAILYPTEGIRGVAGSPRAEGYGYNIMNYMKNANDEIMLMVAMETPTAVANLDEILEVERIDGIFIGPMDLATNMGYFGNPKHPKVQEAIKTIETKVKASGKFLGTVSGSFEGGQPLWEKGYQYVVTLADGVSLQKAAVKTMEKFHEAYPER